MGPSMCCCGALLGTRIAYGASGGAPSSSPWRFSIRPRTFAEIAWRREVLCTWSPTNHTRRRQGLRTGSPDAVGGARGSCAANVSQRCSRSSEGIAALDGFANTNPVGVQTRNGEGHGKDQIVLSQGPGGYHRRPHIRPGNRGNPGPECGWDICRGCDSNGYTRQSLASLSSSPLLPASAFLPPPALPSALVVAQQARPSRSRGARPSWSDTAFEIGAWYWVGARCRVQRQAWIIAPPR